MTIDSDLNDAQSRIEIVQALISLGAVVSSQNGLFLSITEALVPMGAFKEEKTRKEYFAAMRKMLADASALNEQIKTISERLQGQLSEGTTDA